MKNKSITIRRITTNTMIAVHCLPSKGKNIFMKIWKLVTKNINQRQEMFE